MINMSRRRHQILLPALVVVAALVAGCGPGPREQALRACQVLDWDAAQKVFGEGSTIEDEPSAAPTADPLQGISYVTTQCNYKNSKSTLYALVLMRTPLTNAGVERNEEFCDNIRTADSQDLEGVADQAVWVPGKGDLCVYAHGVVMLISTNLNNSGGTALLGGTLEGAKRIAAEIIPRIAE
ncbi:hypothetical protein [Streptosporangium sp. NPDC002607]